MFAEYKKIDILIEYRCRERHRFQHLTAFLTIKTETAPLTYGANINVIKYFIHQGIQF